MPCLLDSHASRTLHPWTLALAIARLRHYPRFRIETMSTGFKGRGMDRPETDTPGFIHNVIVSAAAELQLPLLRVLAIAVVQRGIRVSGSVLPRAMAPCCVTGGTENPNKSNNK
jgi:hypothetical protein